MNVYNYDIIFDKFGCGSCVWSLYIYFLGKFSVIIKCVDGDMSGLFMSFYIFFGEGSMM